MRRRTAAPAAALAEWLSAHALHAAFAGPADVAEAAALAEATGISPDPRLPERRRSEFLLGRLAARRALFRLGVRAGALHPGPAGPRFPEGVAGSISHSRGAAVALVGAATSVEAVGVDLERTLLPLAAIRHVCSTEEATWVRAAATSGEAAQRLAVVFSAKESLFKAWSAMRREELRLRDVELALAEPGGAGMLRVSVVRPAALAARTSVWASGARAGDAVVTAVAVGRAEGGPA